MTYTFPPQLLSSPLLLAFDLDGTLVPELGINVPQNTISALLRLHGLGARLCIITGRDLVTPNIAKAAPFDALCSQNGGRIELAGQVQPTPQFSEADLSAVLEHQLEGVRVILYSDGVLYMDLPEGESVPDWIATRGYRPLTEAGGKAVHKVGFYHPEVAQHAQRLRQSHPHLVITGAQPPYQQYLTVTPKGAHKGAALATVAKALNIPLERCVVFGDTDNDIAMFELAGHAVQSGDLPVLAPYASDQIAGPEQLGEYLHALAEALEHSS